MARMDDPSSKKTVHRPDGFGWLRNALEWLEMACTPCQVFSITSIALKTFALRDFHTCVLHVFAFFKTIICKTFCRSAFRLTYIFAALELWGILNECFNALQNIGLSVLPGQ